MRQRTPEANDRICNHLGCLGVSAGAGKSRMSYRTELLHVVVLVRSSIAVLIPGISHSAIGARVFVGLTIAIGVFYTLDTLVNGVPNAGHVDIINMFGREHVAGRLELLVVGQGSETKTSRGLAELQREKPAVRLWRQCLV
eukprot:6619494-Pyramimonas_sp.AAC.2